MQFYPAIVASFQWVKGIEPNAQAELISRVRSPPDNAVTGNWLSRAQTQRLRKRLFLISPPSRAILGPLDILVDIGAPAEKEVIQ